MSESSTNATFFKSPVSLVGRGKRAQFQWSQFLLHARQDLGPFLIECGAKRKKVFACAPEALVTTEPLDAVFVDLKKVDQIVEHRQPDQVISVETGITLGALDNLLKRHNQWLPFSGDPGSTICETILSGDGGCLEHAFGGPRHLVLGLEVALGSGKTIKTGGKVVKNVTGYDLCKLFVGSRGTLGIPHLAHLRLYARPESSAALLFFSTDPLQLLAHARSLWSTGLPIAALEIVDTASFSTLLDDSAASELAPVLNAAVPPKAVLFLQLFEHEPVIEEVVSILVKALPGEIICRQTTDVVARSLLSGLSKLPRACITVEAACSPSLMEKLLAQVLKQHSSVFYQARLGSGRLRFFVDAAQCLVLLPEIERFAQKLGQSVTLSTQGSAWEIEVSTVPATAPSSVPVIDLSAGRELKRSLKESFDPANCLNPLARL